MQQKLLFLFLLFSSIISAQITYEHPYYDGSVYRIVLENSGEKYYLVNNYYHKLDFYNANHTFWKSIVLPIPDNNYTINVSHVSENKLNNDSLLEIIYTTYSAPGIYQSKIINENGNLLLTVDNCFSLSLDEQQGIPTKIISKSTTESKVFSVPELSLEHTYIENETKRIKLENSGEKYYGFNTTTGVLTIYNNDHTLWKSLTLTKPVGYSFSGISFLSENQINDDNLLELGYGYYINGNNPASQTKIINENGVTLLTVENAQNIGVSSIEGMSNKLIAHISATTDTHQTNIYACPSLALEHTYEGTIDRVKLEISGEKYYDVRQFDCSQITSFPQQTIIYNSDHTIWKTIPTPTSFSQYESLISVQAIENILNYDNGVKIVYTTSSCTLDGGHYSSYIVNEDGTLLLNIPNASVIFLSEFQNLPKKLIAHVFNNNGNLNFSYSSRVYGLDGGPEAGIEDFNLQQVSISPNPTSSYLEFKSQNSIIKKAVIYDFQGKIVQEYEDENLKKIDVQKINTGFYTLILNDDYNNSSAQKFIKY